MSLIEEKLNWGDSKLWHNDVFTELSEKIHEETKVLLSATTLKRVWGRVNYKSTPSISTLNALAQFAGYTNWRDFKNAKKESKLTFYQKTVSANFRVIMFSAFIIAVLFISILAMSNNKSAEAKDYSKILFKSKPIVEGLPNSVIFDFNLEGVTSNNILIQQYWDTSKTIEINKDQTQATGQYYYPGYFRAKLLIDKEIVREHDLFIKTKGWMGTIDYEPIPKYFEQGEVKVKNTLAFSKEVFEEISGNEKPVNSTFHFVDDLGDFSGDNFQLESEIKSTFNEKWGVCQKTTLIIIGTKSAFLIPFSITGCASEMNLMLSDVYLEGKKNDLSALGTDLSDFRKIKVLNQNKKVSVFIDSTQVYTKAYEESIGTIVGVRFRFKGVGEVKDFRLSNLEGNKILE
ncbi:MULTISPECIES: hypothetical protein [unclassified Tenacibaculum]|uniref:hypothetical protein n=1 Tax=unclassified Tenacibaculum TaxID=2635139 RepID=UPI001F3A11D9|nr:MULTISPECIES: hypothetical protein [unclassified Tenacibaculum]MCF2874327.1 hypothetical protein [Tenacibaculum sp. Cn5-1]MCF2934908.1 hypothetical protein [Tenacibaculum sp. Cn5-34]MCG7511118.1 hypothetical protein [Tenacibaculum sp. Cn5-46]